MAPALWLSYINILVQGSTMNQYLSIEILNILYDRHGPNTGFWPPMSILHTYVSTNWKKIQICQNGKNLSYWSSYSVMYQYKCKLKYLKKKYQEKWQLKCNSFWGPNQVSESQLAD